MPCHSKAVVFDFDGTIIDTETVEFETWMEVFSNHGCQLPRDEYSACIGTADAIYDIYGRLEELSGRSVDRVKVRLERRARYHERLQQQPVLPGIVEWIAAADSMGLVLAIASCSTYEHIDSLLCHHGLRQYFSVVASGDAVEKVKPHPEVYQLALDRLGVQPCEAIAVEDSPNGVAAAKAAGLVCVCVPNAMTASMSFPTTDLTLRSLVDITLVEALATVSSVESA